MGCFAAGRTWRPDRGPTGRVGWCWQNPTGIRPAPRRDTATEPTRAIGADPRETRDAGSVSSWWEFSVRSVGWRCGSGSPSLPACPARRRRAKRTLRDAETPGSRSHRRRVVASRLTRGDLTLPRGQEARSRTGSPARRIPGLPARSRLPARANAPSRCGRPCDSPTHGRAHRWHASEPALAGRGRRLPAALTSPTAE